MKYKIQRGDTLYSVAKNNNMNLLDLLALNKQIKNPDIVKTGEEINVYSDLSKDIQFKPTMPKKEFITNEISGTGIPVRDKIGFEVRKKLYNTGLSMYDEKEAPSISGTGVPVKDQIKNNMQQRKYYLKNQMASLLMRPQEKYTEKLAEEYKKDFVDYTIKKGDTLSKIAAKNKLNIDQLYLANIKTLDSPHKINIGQTIRVPQFGIQQAEEFEERKNLPTKQPRERILPSNVRQLLSDINPINRIKRKNNMAMEDFTEEHLTPEEFNAAKDIVRSVIADGKNTISYKDFETSESAYDDVGGEATGIKKAIQKFQDPAFALKTLIGQATITQNDRGETLIIDRYNFNEKDPNSFKDYAQKVARIVSDPIYGTFREAGSLLGSNKGEGSYIRLNLGKL